MSVLLRVRGNSVAKPNLFGWGLSQRALTVTGVQDYPLLISPLPRFQKVSNGLNHVLAINQGRLYTWGNNFRGKTGVGASSGITEEPLLNPTISGTGVTSISAGPTESAFAIQDGRLYSWGYAGFDSSFQLGRGDGVTNQLVPGQILGFEDWDMVSAGDEFGLALRGGKLYSWGWNASGRTGRGTTAGSTSSPTRVGAFEDWTMVSANHTTDITVGSVVQATLRAHALGIRTGKLYSWGSNQNGRTGRGTTSGNTLTPTQVGTFEDWEFVAAGSAHSFGIRAGKLYAWGWGDSYRLGLGNETTRTSPVQVGTFEDWEFVSPDTDSGMGIRQGRLYGWGSPSFNVLGTNNNLASSVPVPWEVGSGSPYGASGYPVFDNWTDVSIHGSGTLAIRS